MFLALVLLANLFIITLCHQQDPPYLSYLSRPDILAPALDVRVYDEDAISPGYILLSTWSDDSDGVVQNGPYIYTNDGELVYSGHQPSNPADKYFNFQTHALANGTTRLSVFQGTSSRGRGKGHVALLDSSYQLIQTISSPESTPWAYDFHEFLLLDEGRIAVTVSLQPKQADLSVHGIKDGVGWLLDSVFHVLDLESNENFVFEWRASEHISLHESVLPPSLNRFAGMSYGAAYDYFHINSIDRFENGDWLLSARHTNTIYRISGSDGSIIWRLGGTSSSFGMVDFIFSAQHDARIVSESSDRLVISLFDNAFNGMAETSKVSSAIIIELDLQLMLAQLSKRYFPLKGGLAQNQGSVQNLPNGSTLVSWGLKAEFSEFDKHGNRILDVAFVDPTTRAYRISKSEWIATPPVEAMALYLYAKNATSSTHFWMSWNGATEVEDWIVYDESSAVLGRIESMGFETHLDAGKFVSGAYVEAIGRDDKVLGRSKKVDVFIPPAKLGDICEEEHCTMQVLLSDAPAGGAKSVKPAQHSNGVLPSRDRTWSNVGAGLIAGIGIAKFRWSSAFARVAAIYLPR